jgi:hypothetical protein
MVTLPKEFVATKFPGYFWNTSEKKLYSVKVSGYLHPLRYTRASPFTHGVEGYRVSVSGERRWLTLAYLNKLRPNEDTVYPVQLEVVPKPKKVAPPPRIEVVSVTVNLSLFTYKASANTLSISSKGFGGEFPHEIIVPDASGVYVTFTRDVVSAERNQWWDGLLMRYIPTDKQAAVNYLVVYHEH